MTVGFAGSLALWWSVSERGIGLTSDSVSYWSTSEQILATGAFGSPWQQPLTAWPLGYPVLLATISAALGITVLTAGTLIAVSLPPATTWLSWLLLGRVTANPLLVIGGVLAATLAGPMLGNFNKLLTDGLFTVGVLALVLLLCRVLEAEHASRNRWLAAAIVLTSVLCLLRYVGAAPAGDRCGCLGADDDSAPISSCDRIRLGVARRSLDVLDLAQRRDGSSYR